jgi:hypothetical protein
MRLGSSHDEWRRSADQSVGPRHQLPEAKPTLSGPDSGAR